MADVVAFLGQSKISVPEETDCCHNTPALKGLLSAQRCGLLFSGNVQGYEEMISDSHVALVLSQ